MQLRKYEFDFKNDKVSDRSIQIIRVFFLFISFRKKVAFVGDSRSWVHSSQHLVSHMVADMVDGSVDDLLDDLVERVAICRGKL